MKLNSFFIEKDEIIEWDRFLSLLKEIEVPVVRNDDIVYHKYDFKYPKVFIGGGDWEINQSNFSITPELKLMIGTNLNIEKNEKILGMPIGMPSLSHDKIIGDLDKIIKKNKETKQYVNMCYCGFRDSTYESERSFVRNLFENENWVTSTTYDRTEDGHSKYLNNIYNHKFILCPRGNGIDTHRIWETLYLRSIPIVKKCTAMSHFYDLPILWIDDWKEINFEFLEEKYNEIINKDFNFEKLNIYYYVKKFKEIDE